MMAEVLFTDFLERSAYCRRLVLFDGAAFDWKLPLVATEWGKAVVHRDCNLFTRDAMTKAVVEYWSRETDRMIAKMLEAVDPDSRFLLAYQETRARWPKIERTFLLHPRGYDFDLTRLTPGHSPTNLELADSGNWRKLP